MILVSVITITVVIIVAAVVAECKDYYHDNSLCSNSSWTNSAVQSPGWHW